VSSSTSSSRRFALAFVTVFFVSAVIFVAGSEALIRVYVAPRDTFDARKDAFLNGTETSAAFGDSRVVSGLVGGDGLANFADAGADLDTILGKLDAYIAMGRGRRIVLQLAPQHFALNRLNDNQQDRLQEFVDPQRGLLQFLRPHYRRYLFEYWSAVIDDPQLLWTNKPTAQATEVTETTLLDRPLADRWRQARIRTQLHIPVAGYATTQAMTQLRATLRRAKESGLEICLIGFPVSGIYRKAAAELPLFLDIRNFYKGFARQFDMEHFDLWDAYDDRYFTNVDHLNDAGARRMTREIRRRCRV